MSASRQPAAMGRIDAAAVCAYRLEEQVGYLIRRAHQRASAIFDDVMRDFDVTPVQFAILMTLMDKPGVDQVTLAAHVALDAATSGSAIGRLEARGWLRRECDPRDRRRKLLWITPEGAQAGAEMALAAPRIQERLVAPLAPEERAQLSLLLSKLEEGSP